MSEELVYREALGVETGDIVTTSYGTGPYEVREIIGPHYWYCDWNSLVVREYPVISLVLVRQGHEGPVLFYHMYWINDVRREGERYFDDQGDEVFVEKPQARPAMSMPDLLSAAEDDPRTRPYRFQAGVDYDAGDGRVWHCPACGLDFNGSSPFRCGVPACPRCAGHEAPVPVFLFRKSGGEERVMSEFDW